MIVFSAADLEKSRGAVHQSSDTTLKVQEQPQEKSPYAPNLITKSFRSLSEQAQSFSQRQPLVALSCAALLGTLVGGLIVGLARSQPPQKQSKRRTAHR